MYLEFFGLREYPFQLTPDSDFMYLSESHAQAKAAMDYSIWNRDGFVVVTGEVGTGKTTLIQKLLSELDAQILVAKIFQTQLNEVEFLQAVLNEFGIKAFNANKVELLDLLNNFFIDQFVQSKQLVLVVDEAQNLSYRVLEEIRMLSGLETQKEKMLHVILVGQPELRNKLESPDMYQLLQRIRLRFHLEPLKKKDVELYVKHRVAIAGAEKELFDRDTFELIFDFTGGVPRLINTLCDTALTFAFADSVESVKAKTIRHAVKELNWPAYKKRTQLTEGSKQLSKEKPAQQANDDSGQRRQIDMLTQDLARVDTILPSLLGIAERMVKIEGQLRRIADRMEDGVDESDNGKQPGNRNKK